jgi:hypothetical protein
LVVERVLITVGGHHVEVLPRGDGEIAAAARADGLDYQASRRPEARSVEADEDVARRWRRSCSPSGR